MSSSACGMTSADGWKFAREIGHQCESFETYTGDAFRSGDLTEKNEIGSFSLKPEKTRPTSSSGGPDWNLSFPFRPKDLSNQ